MNVASHGDTMLTNVERHFDCSKFKSFMPDKGLRHANTKQNALRTKMAIQKWATLSSLDFALPWFCKMNGGLWINI